MLRCAIISLLLLPACGLEEASTLPEEVGTVRAAGLEAPGERGESFACDAQGPQGVHLRHVVRFLEGGIVLAECSVGTASASASTRWGRTGYSDAFCEVAVGGLFWRFQVVQDHSASVAGAPGSEQEHLLPCAPTP